MSLPDPAPSPEELPGSIEAVPSTIQRLDTTADGPPQWEFTPAQERLIGDLAGKMYFVGIVLFVVGIATLVIPLVIFAQWRFEPSSLIYLLIGFWTQSAAKSLRRATQTQGHDISHLIDALGSLRKLYTLTFWLLVIVLIYLGLMLALWLIGWEKVRLVM
jgi:hypothetical protein